MPSCFLSLRTIMLQTPTSISTSRDVISTRMETLAACAVECDACTEVLKALLACATTDAALDVLEAAGLLEQTMRTLGRRIHATLLRCVPEGAQLGFVCFTNAGGRGVLTQSENALALMREWR